MDSRFCQSLPMELWHRIVYEYTSDKRIRVNFGSVCKDFYCLVGKDREQLVKEVFWRRLQSSGWILESCSNHLNKRDLLSLSRVSKKMYNHMVLASMLKINRDFLTHGDAKDRKAVMEVLWNYASWVVGQRHSEVDIVDRPWSEALGRVVAPVRLHTYLERLGIPKGRPLIVSLPETFDGSVAFISYHENGEYSLTYDTGFETSSECARLAVWRARSIMLSPTFDADGSKEDPVELVLDRENSELCVIYPSTEQVVDIGLSTRDEPTTQRESELEEWSLDGEAYVPPDDGFLDQDSDC